jgi:hypothetical protein
MPRHLAFALGLAAAVSLLTAGAGCSTTNGEGAPDAAAMSPESGGDAGEDASSTLCTAAGGQCLGGDLACTGVLGPQDCGGGGSFCCVPNAIGPDAGSCTGANVRLIQASNYDQSCTTDSDCIGVGLGNVCFVCDVDCPNAAINRSAQAQYRTDVPRFPASDVDCGCPTYPVGPCCVGGMCQMGTQCANPVPTDAAADTGVDAAVVDAATDSATDGGGADAAADGGPADAGGG